MEKIKNYFSNTNNLFLIICIIFVTIAFAAILLGNGYPLRTLTWNAESGGILPDFFETVKDSKYLRPYEGLCIYPPLVYISFYPISNLIITDEAAWDQTPYSYNWTYMTTTANAVIIGFIFFTIITIMTLYLTSRELKFNAKKAFLFAIIFLTSPGYIFMIERGNIVILAALLIFIYLYLYNSKNKIYREISLISLAIAACFKIYPAIFGILLLIDKRYKDAIKCIIYALLLFIIPFVFTGGIETISNLVNNIAKLNLDYQTNLRGFGYGYKINISNFIDAFTYCITGNNASPILIDSIRIIFAIMISFIVLFAKARWKKIMALTIAMLILPGFSYVYTAVYLIVPLTYYIKENVKVTDKNILYTMLFAIAFIPFPYGYVLRNLPGANKISFSTLIIEFSLILFIVVMLFDTIKEIIDKRKIELIK